MKGFLQRRPIWLNRPLGLDAVRKFAEQMEYETARFYRSAAQASDDDAVRDLLTRLAAAEDKHEKLAHKFGAEIEPSARATEDQTARRMFVLQYVQPGLAGLMDGSVSTLAPLFAAAFATHNTWSTFLVGLAAAAAVLSRIADRVGRRRGQHQTLLKIVRKGKDEYDEHDLGPVLFVPLVGAQGWAENGRRSASNHVLGHAHGQSLPQMIAQAAEPLPDFDDAARAHRDLKARRSV